MTTLLESFAEKVGKFEILETSTPEHLQFYDRSKRNEWTVVKLPRLRVCVLKNSTIDGKDWGTTFYREPKSHFDENMARDFLTQALIRHHKYLQKKHRKETK